MIRTVFKPSRRKNGKRVFARLYRGRYRLDGQEKLREVPLGTPNRQTAEERLTVIIREQQDERDGRIAPKKQRDAAQRPLADHIEDFISIRRSLQRDERYVKQLRTQLLRLAEHCSWSTAKDITAESFEGWRVRQRTAPKTLNEYHNALSAFLKWLEPKTGVNPVRFVQKVDARSSKKRERRALTLEELRRMVAVSGDCGIVILTAGFTGIRRDELVHMEWRDFHEEAERPFVEVRASITKNHKRALLPLHPELVSALREFRKRGAEPMARVFKGLVPRMPRYRKFLEAARIPYVDAKGEYADFHSLRKTFGTMLALAGVPMRVAMELMRLSDMRLVVKIYTDAGMLPIDDTVSKLPGFNTGSETAPQIAPQKSVPASPWLSAVVLGSGIANASASLINKGFGAGLSAVVPKGADLGKDGKWCALQGSNLRL